ncbi:hypothetical protein HFO56_02045 [Rhizobium laguerreae]|uniref:hypothetical protein n=1 Tax=Rhizobium laguerreae TaxID=1076926 RepID=UPI001C8FCFFC|nr:hypothetical protein [Rhizobium laguerreae]MBY3151189.1 hypothetical protein [Rhizobium laguerreae]
MDLSFAKKGIDDSERAEVQEQLLKGQPLFLEIDDVVSADTVSGVLVLGAFGAPSDTKVHVKQVRTHSHIDSLTRHIQGNDYFPALRKGDIVAFDRVFIDGGDAMTAHITARTHDGMKGRVQFLMGMARASSTMVSKRGAQQFLTIVDGSQAYRADDDGDIRAAYKNICAMPWTAGAGGFIARTFNGRTVEYHVNGENPLEGFIEEMTVQGHLHGKNWIELIPARKFPVGRDQVARDVDVRNEVKKAVGKVGKQFMPQKGPYPGFRKSAIILCDEDEWAFGGKTGKVHRVAAGIQPLDRGVPVVESRSLPSRIHHRNVMDVSGLYSEATMDRMAEERAERRPPEPEDKRSETSYPRADMASDRDHDDQRSNSPTANSMPFSF